MTTERNPNHYRQGDVGIAKLTERIDALKPVAPENGLLILARGEATGHHHAISILDYPDAVLFEAIGQPGTMVLQAPSGCTVTHQEHAPIMLPPGDYRIERQVEYDPEGEQRVMD